MSTARESHLAARRLNSSSRTKLKADPTPDLVVIRDAAERCLRYHPSLAVPTWTRTIKVIRDALENIEDIYDSANEAKP